MVLRCPFMFNRFQCTYYIQLLRSIGKHRTYSFFNNTKIGKNPLKTKQTRSFCICAIYEKGTVFFITVWMHFFLVGSFYNLGVWKPHTIIDTSTGHKILEYNYLSSIKYILQCTYGISKVKRHYGSSTWSVHACAK